MVAVAFETAGAATVFDAVWVGERARSGLPTVCGAARAPGRAEPVRFVAFVDAAALGHRGLARVAFEGEPGFARDWARHCEIAGS